MSVKFVVVELVIRLLGCSCSSLKKSPESDVKKKWMNVSMKFYSLRICIFIYIKNIYI
jgi:hypothetical protein